MTALTSASFPSRQFMVQQAVLNTLSERYPHTLKNRGVAAAANMLISGHEDGGVARVITRWVAKEFNALAAQYPRAA